ncbi:MAG: hypothetical protein AMXMBFR82_42980 [Candidatus Hydrogenedentota bacterium]
MGYNLSPLPGRKTCDVYGVKPGCIVSLPRADRVRRIWGLLDLHFARRPTIRTGYFALYHQRPARAVFAILAVAFLHRVPWGRGWDSPDILRAFLNSEKLWAVA